MQEISRMQINRKIEYVIVKVKINSLTWWFCLKIAVFFIFSRVFSSVFLAIRPVRLLNLQKNTKRHKKKHIFRGMFFPVFSFAHVVSGVSFGGLLVFFLAFSFCGWLLFFLVFLWFGNFSSKI